MNHLKSRKRRGLTLMEVVISSLLVGTVLVSSLSATAAWRRFDLQTKQQEIGRRIAEDLVGEIVATAFLDPTQSSPVALGRESGELATARSNWNDVDDYHGMLETVVRDKSGTINQFAAGYRRSVVVSAAVPIENSPGYSISPDLNSPLRHIAVTVTSPSGRLTVVSALKSNIETSFPSALNHLRSIAVDLADDGVRTTRSVGVMNHPEVRP